MKRWLWLFLVLIVVFPGLSGGESDVPTVRVVTLTGPTGLSMIKLMENPDLQNAVCSFEVLKSPELAVAKLISGEADFAGLPTNTAAILYNKGVGIQLVSIIGWGVMYVVSDNPKIRNWKDLKGKEVYVAYKGAVPDILFRYLLIKNGLTEQDVKIKYFNSAVEIAQLLASGKAAPAALPEPWVTQAVEKNPKMKVVLDFQKEWKRLEKQGEYYPQTCVVVRKQFAKERPGAVREFLRGLEKSMKWLQLNRQAGGLLAEKYVQISAVAVEKGLSRCNLKYSEAYKVQPEVNRFLQRFMEFAPESVGGKVPDEGFYYQP